MDKLEKFIGKTKIKIKNEIKVMNILSNPMISDTDKNEIQDLIKYDFNWDEFYESCNWEGVFPVVYNNIKKIKLDCIPKNITKKLSMGYKKNGMRMLLFLSELSRIYPVLEKENIRPIVLKGLSASTQIYEDINLRKSCDIDILINIKDFKKSDLLLKELGYVRIQPRFNITDKELEVFLDTAKHGTYHLKEKNITIELHWRKTLYDDNRKFDYEELIKKSKKIKQGSLEFLGLNNLENFVQLAVHGSRHIWVQKRWLNDINWICKKDKLPDIKILIKRFKKENILNILLQTFILLKLYYEFDIPNEIQDLIKKNPKSIKVAKLAFEFSQLKREERFSNFSGNSLFSRVRRKTLIYKMTLMEKRKYKFSYILDMAFKPHLTDLKLISLPKSLHFLYVFIRPVRGVLRHILKLFFKEKRL